MLESEENEPIEMDQWNNVRDALQYAIFIIRHPRRTPPAGYVRTVSEAYTEYYGLDQSQLDANKSHRVRKDAIRFNKSLRFVRFRRRIMLKEHNIEISPLDLIPPERE